MNTLSNRLHAIWQETQAELDKVNDELESCFGGITATDHRATSDDHRRLSQKLIDLMKLDQALKDACDHAQHVAGFNPGVED